MLQPLSERKFSLRVVRIVLTMPWTLLRSTSLLITRGLQQNSVLLDLILSESRLGLKLSLPVAVIRT